MAAKRITNEPESRRGRPATTPQGRENQLSALAYDAAEKQMLAGTASSQVITHFLKMGSSRELLEQQRMAHEIELMAEKKKAMEANANMEVLYKNAIEAMKSYSGSPPPPPTEDFDD